ncbi:hypothetical protein [uncultured Collinsella sp.]|uniref:hypothetical protein n=1 Tax=uncultured Collinsella sp. TaxID=165190 RepID=UPI0025F3168A|nr:hypothetical protein [uncultured Collinsella sp.]
MGVNRIGSNLKPSVRVPFPDEPSRRTYNHLMSDVAELTRLTRPQLLIHLLLSFFSKTDEGKEVARNLYSADEPSCLEVYSSLFENISALKSERLRNTRPLVEAFLNYALSLEISIDLADDGVLHLRNQWDSVHEAVSHSIKTSDLDLLLAEKNIRELGSVLQSDCYAMQSITPFVSQMLDCWETIKTQSCTFRVLSDFASLGYPARKGAKESVENRRALLCAVDEYYSGGEEECS